MTLIEPGASAMNRRARARGMTFLHSDAFAKAAEALKADTVPAHRLEHFLSAVEVHDQALTGHLHDQKAQPIGRVRERLHPRTLPRYELN